jgi:hypothetical protein
MLRAFALLALSIAPVAHAADTQTLDSIPPTICPGGVVVYGTPCPPSQPTGGGVPDDTEAMKQEDAPSPADEGGRFDTDTISGDYSSSGSGSGGYYKPSAPAATPPAAATISPAFGIGEGSKVLSYFQHGKTRVDTRNAFGFVLLPRTAVTIEERQIQNNFCEILLASMDFMTPGAIAARADVLATYWPVSAAHESFEIKAAFESRDCDLLLAWYDHKLARSLTAKAGIADLSGPLLITWPSGGATGDGERNPLVVDFSRADYAHATKALQYWFRQVRNRPELWTNRIREGTIRAELADAINDTAGVVLAVLYGKWDSLNTVNATP